MSGRHSEQKQAHLLNSLFHENVKQMKHVKQDFELTIEY
jgi:hypothetical protein